VEGTKTSKEHPDEYGGTFSTLMRLASGSDITPSQRNRLTELHINESIADFTRRRMSAAAKTGKDTGAIASTMKLHWTNGLKVSRDLGIELLGADGMLQGKDQPEEGTVQHFFLSMPSASIAGGSDEVQHNIIGERALGLPKDVSLDPNTPFTDIPRN
jgi:alkylation response protein AidB-like acyl-CoA dehydrogenase